MIGLAGDAEYAADAGENFAVSAFCHYLLVELDELRANWPPIVAPDVLQEFEDDLLADTPRLSGVIDTALKAGELLDRQFRGLSVPFGSGALDLLAPEIVASSYEHLRHQLYRDAALNSVIAVFDLLRKRTGLNTDGVSLVGEALSLERPLLTVSDLNTPSGRDEQKGLIQLLQGVYQAIRNPNAHSLLATLDEPACWQILAFSSFLARRVREAHSVE